MFADARSKHNNNDHMRFSNRDAKSLAFLAIKAISIAFSVENL